jgi:putative ABC transport system permease protein
VTPLFRLAAKSLWNRRGTALLTAFAIAVSVALLLGVQQVRTEARESFANTLSGTDLVVGARSSPLNLLLYAVFRVGDATANVSWETYQKVAKHRDVAWTIPLSLGDSHQGFRVLGTSTSYFEHYRYGRRQPLRFTAGKAFADAEGVVIGAAVARELGYHVGDPIVIAHGVGEVSFTQHDHHPLRLVGILAPTGTPVDRTVHVSLDALTEVHRTPAEEAAAATGVPLDTTPPAITAFLVGMKERSTLFVMQQALNTYRGEPVTAVIPGVALTQLWQLVGVADTALLIVAAFVLVAGLLGMLTALLTSLNERRREMAILRSVGARPGQIFGLLVSEAAFLSLLGAVAGLALQQGLLALLRPWVEAKYGLVLALGSPAALEWAMLGGVVVAGAIIGLIPAWRAYRLSLADGLTVRV